MSTTWILVSNRSHARLFESIWPDKSLKRLKDIPHPQGQLKNRDINTDRPGRSFDSVGQGRHAMSAKLEPVEYIAQKFALDLAELLNEGRMSKAYDKLVLIAEPKFLGFLRMALDKNTAYLVTQSVDKDLLEVKDEELYKYLK